MKKLLKKIFYAAMTLSLVMSPQTAQAAEKEYFSYKLSDQSSNVEVIYMIYTDKNTHGDFIQLNVGETITVDKDYGVVFYVKPKLGYDTGSTFLHKNGRTFAEMGNYSSGIYSHLGNWQTSMRGGYFNITDSVNQAKEAGFVKQFLYTRAYPEDKCREFKITATPLKVKVNYDLNGGVGENIVDNTNYYHSHIREFNTHTITISNKIPTKAGYRFTNWSANTEYSSNDIVKVDDVWNYLTNGNITFRANWELDPAQWATVNFNFTGDVPLNVTQIESQELIKGMTASEPSVSNIDGYVFNGWSFDFNTPINNDTTISGEWVENKVTVNYQTNDSSMGTVTKDTETVKVVTQNLEGSIAQPKNGYVFEGWYNANGECVSTNSHFVPDEKENATYTAHFRKRNDLSYKVIHHYRDRENNEETVIETIDSVEYGTLMNYTQHLQHNDKTYIFDTVTYGTKDHMVGTDLESNVVNVYYDIDEIGNHDGIQDKYQIVVKYQVINGLWNDKSNNEITEIVTLHNAQNELSIDGVGVLNAPAAGKEPNTGYMTGKWAPALPILVSKDNHEDTYVYTYKLQEKTLKVNYVDEKGNNIQEPYIKNVNYGSDYNLKEQILNEITVDENHYILENQSSSEISGIAKDNVEITLTYTLDNFGTNPEKPDNIPDKYQIAVTYKVFNGSWDNGNNKDIIEVITLHNSKGELSQEGAGALNMPAVGHKPNIGYEAGKWGTVPILVTKKDNGKIYDYTYKLQTKTITINYVNEENEILKEPYIEKVYYGDKYSLSKIDEITIDGNHYILDKQTGANMDGIATEDIEVTLIYTLDNHGTNPDNGDNVPDKYQVKVDFKVNNGTIKGNDCTYVTLEDGIGHLTINQIPQMNANDGYDQKSLSWNQTPNTSFNITQNITFIGTFSKRNDLKYTIVHHYLDAKEQEIGKEEIIVKNAVFDSEMTFDMLIEYNNEKYIYNKTEYPNGNKVSLDFSKNIVDVYYDIDTIGTIIEDPEASDEVADKHQVRVDFKAINGTVSGIGYTYVTLDNETKIGYLTDEQIPTVIANEGFNQYSLTWNTVEPTNEVGITENITFTAKFEEIVVTPLEPTNPIEPAAVAPVIPTPRTTTQVSRQSDPVIEAAANDEEEVIIDDETTPLAGTKAKNSWALVNLISTIVTALLGIIMLLAKHKKEEEEEDNEEESNEYKRRRWTKVLGLFTSILSLIIFIFTEDMRLPMVMIDKWTLLMVILAVVNIVTLILGRKWKKV